MPNNAKIAEYFTMLADRSRDLKLKAHYQRYAEQYRPSPDAKQQRDLDEPIQGRLKARWMKAARQRGR
jgi:hypothetical protein